MSYYKFGPNDKFTNRIKTYPQYEFFIYDTNIFVNQHANITGSYTQNIRNVPNGYVSLYEININRNTPAHTYDPNNKTGVFAKAYPFIEYQGNKETFKQYLAQPYVSMYQHTPSGNLALGTYNPPAVGSIITGSYPMSASLTRKLTTTTSTVINGATISFNRTGSALANAARKYTTLSKHFVFRPTGSDNPYSMYGVDSNAGIHGANSIFMNRDLTKESINMIMIPKIFYGSTIRKGSVKLKFYTTGSVIGECTDSGENGELVETTGSTVTNGTGSVVGLVMYDEGVILLTGSANLETGPALGIKYAGSSGAAILSSWKYFGAGLNDGITFDHTIKSASFGVEFKGTNYVNTMTMFCHAKKGDLNHSNNPTYKKHSEAKGFLDRVGKEYTFKEKEYSIKNVVSSSYAGTEEKFDKTTYLSKIAIYDDEGNMIAVANVAKPVKKTEDLEYTFKIKLDI